MELTSGQLTAIKAAILADPVLADFAATGQYQPIANAFNVAASPVYWVWRTAVSRTEIYHSTSLDSTTWNWTTYKAQSVPEQGAWREMFMGDSLNFSLPNARAGIATIFGAGNAQTTHCLATGRRTSTRVEKLLAIGAGSTVSPSTLGFESPINTNHIEAALGSS